MSVIRTASQQNVDPIDLMITAQQARQPTADKLLALPARASPSSRAA